MKTHWQCDDCGRVGFVHHEDNADLWGVMQTVIDNHRKAARECGTGGRESIIRVSISSRRPSSERGGE